MIQFNAALKISKKSQTQEIAFSTNILVFVSIRIIYLDFDWGVVNAIQFLSSLNEESLREKRRNNGVPYRSPAQKSTV